MSLKNFHNEIRRFLRSKEAEVLVIIGKWGVGKTFAWNKMLVEARVAGKIGLNKYAYVSLFGLSGLGDLKSAIFQNTVNRDKAGTAADIATLKDAFADNIKAWRQGLSILYSVFTDPATFMEKVGFLLIREQIVCIDDLERRSEELHMRDVLGVISYLKEQRDCKIVILLNEDQLEEDGQEFQKQLEKVADTIMRFEPTPQESAKIGVDSDTSFATQLSENTSTLGITNIRTIKKIERVARQLETDLSEFDKRVFKQALHSLTLFQFANLQPSEAPALDFILSRSSYEAMLGVENQDLPHPEWRTLLQDYGFGACDSFDSVIMQGVKQGHFDLEGLKAEGSKLEEKFQRQDEDNSFSEAWEIYHGSFDDNQTEVVQRISAAIMSTPRAITPTNLSGSVQLLKELEWRGDIPALIQSYVEGREDGRDFWDLAEQTFGDDVTDPDVRAAFDAKLATLTESRDPKAMLIKLGFTKSWASSDIAFLASINAETLYSILKNAQGDDLRRIIRGALLFSNMSDADVHQKALTALAVEAMERIARESPINRRRVKQKSGITITVPAADGGPEA